MHRNNYNVTLQINHYFAKDPLYVVDIVSIINAFTQRFGVITKIHDTVPQSLPIRNTMENIWIYEGTSLYHNRKEIAFPNLLHLRHLLTGQSVGLLISTHGDLHLYLNGHHAKKIATRLPVNKPLWGAVDVVGSCTKVKSDILSGEL